MDPEKASQSSKDASGRSADARIADLATFASGVVHDLRNPLNVIRTNVYLLRQRLSPDEARMVRALERIDDQVTLAMRMLDGIQAVYRADHPTPQRVQVNDAVRQVIETTPLPEGIQLRTTPGEGLPLLTVDPQLLDAALRALLRNAVDALAGGGSIRVGTTRVEDRVRIEVEDTGEGIPEEAAARVFEPFFTTRRGRSGLGLTVVRRVAEAHGGSASVRSTPGAGTLAVLELPVTD